ncbi:cell envelope integrity protein TolA [Rhizobium johnstonii]|uniref:cell envelope integrity protein TolA n=1 Tax=Rhizobium johnstonii TaxID=3019933 RepID=UPI003F9A57E9
MVNLSLFVTLLACFSALLEPRSLAAKEPDSGATLTIVARKMQLNGPAGRGDGSDPQQHALSIGHAYLIVGLKTNTGIKEEVIGFYSARGGLGVIKGPGMLKSEHRCGPSDDCHPRNSARLLLRYSETTRSVVLPITLKDRQTIYAVAKNWDPVSYPDSNGRQIVPEGTSEYNILNRNCIDFIRGVVTTLGYPAPQRAPLQTPDLFVEALNQLIAQELKLRSEAKLRRDAEARRIDAEQRAEEDRAARQDAERKLEAERKLKARAARRKSANKAPKGWYECTCPDVHRTMVRYFAGVPFHEKKLLCP